MTLTTKALQDKLNEAERARDDALTQASAAAALASQNRSINAVADTVSLFVDRSGQRESVDRCHTSRLVYPLC